MGGSAGSSKDGVVMGGAGLGGVGNAGWAGQMAGGAAPPTCDSTDVTHAPSTALSLGLGSEASASYMVSDEQGNTYFVGRIYGGSQVRLGGSFVPPPGHLFLLKLDASGQTVWARRFGTDDPSQQDLPVSLELDAQGELVVGAELSRSGFRPEEPEDWGEHQLAVLRFDVDGEQLGAITFPAPYRSRLVRVVPSGEELYLWGSFSTAFSLGDVELPEAAAPNTFAARLDQSGDVLSVSTLPGYLLDAVMSPSGDAFALLQDSTGKAQLAAVDADFEPLWQAALEPNNDLSTLGLDLSEQKLVIASASRSRREPDGILSITRFDLASGSSVSEQTATEGWVLPGLLHVLPDHGVVLTEESTGEGSALIMRLSAEDQPVWATLLCADFKQLDDVAGTLRVLSSGTFEHAGDLPYLDGNALLTFAD